ncbi:hypothetical protein B296_00035875, partial [Ensete ventricosum]
NDQGIVMIWVLFSLRSEIDFKVRAVPQPLLDCSPGIGFACRGVVPTLLGVMVVFMMERQYVPQSLSSGWVLMRFGGAKSPFPLIWRKISICVELRGVVGGRMRLKSDPSILLLDGPEVGPRGYSVRGRFCSSHFLTIRVSVMMKWFALCIIGGTVVEGFSTKVQNSLDMHIPIRNAWITKEGCASGIVRVSVANLLTNWASDSSLPSAMTRSEVAVGFVGSELPSYDSMAGNLKLVDIGLSCISGAKGDICLEFSPVLSFDLVTSFCTSSSLLFTCRSCTWNESIESDDKVFGSRVVCSSPRYEAVEFSGTIEGVSDPVLGGFYSARLGQAGTECSRDPLGWSGAVGAPTDGEPLQYLSGVDVDCPTSGYFCWSARHVCSVMPPAACCHGDCSLAVGLPIDPLSSGSKFHITGIHSDNIFKPGNPSFDEKDEKTLNLAV